MRNEAIAEFKSGWNCFVAGGKVRETASFDYQAGWRAAEECNLEFVSKARDQLAEEHAGKTAIMASRPEFQTEPDGDILWVK